MAAFIDYALMYLILLVIMIITAQPAPDQGPVYTTYGLLPLFILWLVYFPIVEAITVKLPAKSC